MLMEYLLGTGSIPDMKDSLENKTDTSLLSGTWVLMERER